MKEVYKNNKYLKKQNPGTHLSESFITLNHAVVKTIESVGSHLIPGISAHVWINFRAILTI